MTQTNVCDIIYTGDRMIDLYIDFDGVIADTITSSYAMLKELGIDPKETEKVIQFYKKLDWYDFLSKTEEINNSLEEIQQIIKSKLFNVHILTHVTSSLEVDAKTRFIRKKIQDVPIIAVPKGMEKTEAVDAKNAILIDDYTGNLVSWQNAGGIGVRFSTKLHGKGYFVINHLRNILSLASGRI